MSALAVEYDATRETRHLDAKSAPEYLAWQAWLELGGYSSGDAYGQVVAALIIRYPHLAFDEFTDAHIGEFLATRPAKSRANYKARVNSWFFWGYRTRRITSNPVDFLPKIQRAPQPVHDVFTELEQAALEALPLPDGPLMTLMFETGIRQAEARNMRVQRVDFASGMVLVKEGAKRGKERQVPIVPQLAHAINDLILTEKLEPQDFLWYKRLGGNNWRYDRKAVIDAATFHRWWYRCLDDAGVPYVKRDPARGIAGRGNPHSCRHTMATRWRARGLELDDIGDLLGHADVRTTKSVYVHTKAGEIRERMLALLNEENA